MTTVQGYPFNGDWIPDTTPVLIGPSDALLIRQWGVLSSRYTLCLPGKQDSFPILDLLGYHLSALCTMALSEASPSQTYKRGHIYRVPLWFLWSVAILHMLDSARANYVTFYSFINRHSTSSLINRFQMFTVLSWLSLCVTISAGDKVNRVTRK